LENIGIIRGFTARQAPPSIRGIDSFVYMGEIQIFLSVGWKHPFIGVQVPPVYTYVTLKVSLLCSQADQPASSLGLTSESSQATLDLVDPYLYPQLPTQTS
jgi:hypothetical protein